MFSSEVFCWSGSGGFFGGLKIRLTPPWVEAKCVVEDDIGKYEVENKAPGKHFPGPDFPLLKMGKVNLVDKLYIFWGPHFPDCFFW